MKKFLLGLGFTLVLTGCGGKTLTCTMEESESGMEMKAKTVYKFDSNGENVKKANVEMSVKVDDEAKKTLETIGMSMEDLSSSFSEKFDDYKEAGIDVKTKTTDNSLSFKANIDVNKLTDEQLEDIDLNDINYEEVKKDLEESGFTCK